MKKLSLIALTAAAALAICPGALVGQQYDFTITGSGISASGVLTVTPIVGDPGVYGITGITGTYSDTNGTTVSDAAITGLYPDPTYASIITTSYLFSLDNLLYPAGNAPPACFFGTCSTGGQQLDVVGLVFDVAGGNEVGISGAAGTGFPGPYNLNRDISGVYQDGGNNGVGVTFSAVSAPEGGPALLYLLLAGGACFGAMFLVSRSRLANVTAA
jgi:hypothetical protein